jgi:hypothetical protein
LIDESLLYQALEITPSICRKENTRGAIGKGYETDKNEMFVIAVRSQGLKRGGGDICGDK